MTHNAPSQPDTTATESGTAALIPTSDSQQVHQPDSDTSSQKIEVRTVRSPWWEFFLHFSTFGIYTCFWLVARIKELKLLTNQPFKPWLWLFVPNFVVVQFFAFPALNKHLKKLETKFGINYSVNTFRLWAVAVISVTTLFWVTSKFAFPRWVDFIALIFWSGLFCTLSQRFNAIKQKCAQKYDNIQFKGKSSGYSWKEWLVIIPMFPIFLTIAIYSSVSPYLLEEIKPLPDHSIYASTESHYQLPIHGSGWREVEIGSFSDGEAELELAGKIEGSYFVVFKYTNQESLSGRVQDRIQMVETEEPSNRCREERRLTPNGINVITYVSCEGKSLGAPQLNTITIFEHGDELYELIGYISAPKYSFPEHAANFKQMAKEFQPL
ncbi:hypothetical protein [uncultured Photobacterium sp.]|uniref:hypothetical protein n=1 Tax=uncultured Photobacterium sp. TaxID=173973 RepID=UPI002605067D|nr:hypothetical protein [uncultured Photobacterium sp.]